MRLKNKEAALPSSPGRDGDVGVPSTLALSAAPGLEPGTGRPRVPAAKAPKAPSQRATGHSHGRERKGGREGREQKWEEIEKEGGKGKEKKEKERIEKKQALCDRTQLPVKVLRGNGLSNNFKEMTFRQPAKEASSHFLPSISISLSDLSPPALGSFL